MVLINWWMLIVWLAVGFVLYIVIRIRRRSATKAAKTHDSKIKHVAHSARFHHSPQYLAAYRRYKRLILVLVTALGFSMMSAILLSARPASFTVESPDQHNRDIMLCLDISGSMTATDKAIITTFRSITDRLKGERVGLSVFDSSSSLVFPLTSDYDYINDRLSIAEAELSGESVPYFQSLSYATNQGDGSSLIGDGLASCALSFDTDAVQRSRSIILATDNYTNGSQLVTLPQAAQLSKQKGIRVYGINPGESEIVGSSESTAKEFKDQVLLTGGNYYTIKSAQASDQTIVPGIVSRITEQEATRYRGAPQVIQTDRPLIASVILVSSFVAYIVCVMRLKV